MKKAKIKIEYTVEIDLEEFCADQGIEPGRCRRAMAKDYLTEDARQATVAYLERLGCYVNG